MKKSAIKHNPIRPNLQLMQPKVLTESSIDSIQSLISRQKAFIASNLSSNRDSNRDESKEISKVDNLLKESKSKSTVDET